MGVESSRNGQDAKEKKKSDENVYGRQAVAYQSGGALAVCQRRPSLRFLRLIKLKSNEEKFLRKKKIRKRLTDGGIVKGSGQGKNMSRPKWIVKKHCGGWAIGSINRRPF